MLSVGKSYSRSISEKMSLHRERIFVEYDVFGVDCPENRLVKSQQPSTCSGTPQICKTARICGWCYPLWSKFRCPKMWSRTFNIAADPDYMADYQRLLELCRVFLKGKSFTTSFGGRAALALLFPMERIFESYVAVVLRRHLDAQQYRLHVQAKDTIPLRTAMETVCSAAGSGALKI